MNQPVSIILPNYKTPELTRLCLRSIRKFTPRDAVRIIAVDNASADDSLDYLRSLSWIRLIERTPKDIEGMPPALMHTTAMDLALAEVDTPFVLSFHTDTIVYSPDWLDFLLGRINRSDRIAGVGSWKIEFFSPLRRFGKKLEMVETRAKVLLGLKKPEVRFLRSHCALYRTELLKRYTRGFGDGESAGKSIHKHLTDAGFIMEFIPPEVLIKYLDHLNHATMILNPAIGSRKTAAPEARQSLVDRMERFRDILADDSLDR
ncbi:MAG: glycosyltransferase [Lentisphaeria bacterium]|nr:glycosyltransferase [Lentisphaeria bacterium]